MKASIIIFCLLISNLGCVRAMDGTLSKANKDPQSVIINITKYNLDPYTKNYLIASVNRNIHKENGKSEVLWSNIRNDLEKLNENNNSLCKQTAAWLGLLRAFNAVWLGSSAAYGILNKNEPWVNALALLLTTDNITQARNAYFSWKMQPQKDAHSFIVNYSRENPNDCVDQLENASALTGKSLSKTDREKLNLCTLSDGRINMEKLEESFAQPYFYSMSDDKRNIYGFILLLNVLYGYFCSSVPGSDFIQIRNFMAVLNLIAALFILYNPGFACGNLETEKGLRDIIATIEKYVSKKAN